METGKRKELVPKNKGHRQRIKDKFLKTKFENWQDYEILEFALFFVVPQKDTKDIAKNLINKFGSLKELLNADYEEIMSCLKDVKGVKSHATLFLYFLKYFAIKYSEIKVKQKEKLSSPNEVVTYLKNLIGTSSEEKMYALYLNASNQIIDCKKISDGTVSHSAVYPTVIAKDSLLKKARSVIIAHNHPGGISKPSQNDIIATEAVTKALKTIEVVLLDHIIITATDYYSFKDNGLI